VIVDSTVQEKAIAHPTDSRLLEVARSKLVAAAKAAGIKLKQTFAKEGPYLARKAARYAHARQWARMRRAIRRQGTIVGRLSREIERKANLLTQAVRDVLGESLQKAQRIAAQSRQRKAQEGSPKLYAWHAPEVECITTSSGRNEATQSASSRRFTLKNGRWRVPELNMPEGDKSPTACLACALYGGNPGCESVRQVTLETGTSRQKLFTMIVNDPAR
jgi:hypothetical protein